MDAKSRFCDQCGADAIGTKTEKQENIRKTEAKDERMPEQPIIKLIDGMIDPSGKWQWTYGMDMWKNPTILMSVGKVLLLSAQFPVVLSLLLGLEDGFADALLMAVKIEGIVVLVLAALLIVAYPLVTLINGGRYCVLFEMDGAGVRHTQLAKQFKKQQVLAMITAFAGAAAGNPTATGAGLLAGAKQSSYTKFSKVKQVVIHPKRHVIYLNESMQHNQVYAATEDFEAVRDYILSKTPKANIKYKR